MFIWLWVWKNTPTDGPEKAEAWELLKAKAETLEEWLWVWQNTPTDGPEKAEALAMVKAMVKKIID